MSHWAEIDDNNVVIRILVGDNNDPNNDEGYQWLVDNLGGRWIQTSYNNNFRKQYAEVGGCYDENNDVFISKKPFSSWKLDENLDWQAPKTKPNGFFYWDEDNLEWVEIDPQS
jgi:hypothetical protein